MNRFYNLITPLPTNLHSSRSATSFEFPNKRHIYIIHFYTKICKTKLIRLSLF